MSTTTQQRIQTIRMAQARIRNQMREIENRLTQLKASRDPGHYWFTGWDPITGWDTTNRVTAKDQKQGHHHSIFEALRADLETLRRELSAYTSELGRRQKQAAHESAAAASADAARKMEKILQDGENSGNLDGDAIKELQDEQEKALQKWLDALKVDPSDKNILGTLVHLTRMMVGIGDPSRKVDAAMNDVRIAAEKLKAVHEKKFRSNPSVENWKQYWSHAAQSLQVGGDGLDVEQKQLRRLHPEKKFHTLARGESLSSVSRYYYGKEGYWDLIYFWNKEKIGANPEKVPVGTVLKIP